MESGNKQNKKGQKWDKDDAILLENCIKNNTSLKETAENLGRTELATVIRSITHFNYLFEESESIISNKGYSEQYKSRTLYIDN